MWVRKWFDYEVGLYDHFTMVIFNVDDNVEGIIQIYCSRLIVIIATLLLTFTPWFVTNKHFISFSFFSFTIFAASILHVASSNIKQRHQHMFISTNKMTLTGYSKLLLCHHHIIDLCRYEFMKLPSLIKLTCNLKKLQEEAPQLLQEVQEVSTKTLSCTYVQNLLCLFH